MDDLKIVELFNARDEDAISAISDKYGKYCFLVAKNILANDQDAEECVNDTWLKVWNTIPPACPTHMRAFVAKITRNLALDRYRADSAQKRGGGEMTVALSEIEEVIDNELSFDSELERKRLADCIDRFLYSLSEKERNIFIRRYFFIEAIKNIASRYSMTENGVAKVLSRTRQKMRNFLESEGINV